MEKFMKKMWKKSEGFTLVELIVVIAILGILAAVAVPAYSGYITKANEAADEQLVSEINLAIQSAVALQGLDADDVTAAGTIATGGTATVTIAYSADTTKQTAIQNDFAEFLGKTYSSGVTVSGFKAFDTLTRGTNGLLTGSDAN